MKYILLILLAIVSVSYAAGERMDTSILMFPYSASRMASGNTYGRDGGDLTDPGFLREFDTDAKVTFFSGFISGDTSVYYISFSRGGILADMFYFDWGDISQRDDYGEITGIMRPYDISVMCGYVAELPAFRTALTMRVLKRDYHLLEETCLIPAVMFEKDVAHLSAGFSAWFYHGLNYTVDAGWSVRDLEIKAAVRRHSSSDKASFHFGLSYRISDSYEVITGADQGRVTAGFTVLSAGYGFTYSLLYDDYGYIVNGIQLKMNI